MLFAVELGTILGGMGTLLAAVVGALALVQKIRTDKRLAETEASKANTDETQQAFDMQDRAMQEVIATNERLIKEIDRVREKYDQQHDAINRLAGKLGKVTAREQQCRVELAAMGERLHLAEARIAELGG